MWVTMPSASLLLGARTSPVPFTGHSLPGHSPQKLPAERVSVQAGRCGAPAGLSVKPRPLARYQAEGVSYRPLRDGQALLINGPDTKIV